MFWYFDHNLLFLHYHLLLDSLYMTHFVCYIHFRFHLWLIMNQLVWTLNIRNGFFKYLSSDLWFCLSKQTIYPWWFKVSNVLCFHWIGANEFLVNINISKHKVSKESFLYNSLFRNKFNESKNCSIMIVSIQLIPFWQSR